MEEINGGFFEGQPNEPQYSGPYEGDPRDPMTIGDFMRKFPLVAQAARREVALAADNIKILTNSGASDEEMAEAQKRLDRANELVERFVPPEPPAEQQ